MTTGYPTSLDTSGTFALAKIVPAHLDSSLHAMIDAIVAVETAVGINFNKNPLSGSSIDVVAGTQTWTSGTNQIVSTLDGFTTTNATSKTLFVAPLAATSSIELVVSMRLRDVTGSYKTTLVRDTWKRVGTSAPVRTGTAVSPFDLIGSDPGAADASFGAIGGLTIGASANNITGSFIGATSTVLTGTIVTQRTYF